MFLALIAHPQEALHKRYWGIMRVCYVSWLLPNLPTPVPLQSWLQPTDITRTQYTQCHLCSASWRWASNARNMQRPLILNKLDKTCITLVSLYWYTTIYSNQSCRKVKKGETDVDGRIILKWIPSIQFMRVWSWIHWLGVNFSGWIYVNTVLLWVFTQGEKMFHGLIGYQVVQRNLFTGSRGNSSTLYVGESQLISFSPTQHCIFKRFVQRWVNSNITYSSQNTFYGGENTYWQIGQ
jgi:hypothetical protein